MEKVRLLWLSPQHCASPFCSAHDSFSVPELVGGHRVRAEKQHYLSALLSESTCFDRETFSRTLISIRNQPVVFVFCLLWLLNFNAQGLDLRAAVLFVKVSLCTAGQWLDAKLGQSVFLCRVNARLSRRFRHCFNPYVFLKSVSWKCMAFCCVIHPLFHPPPPPPLPPPSPKVYSRAKLKIKNWFSTSSLTNLLNVVSQSLVFVSSFLPFMLQAQRKLFSWICSFVYSPNPPFLSSGKH